MPLRSVSFVAEPELPSEDEDLEDAELSDEPEGESEDIPNVGVTPKSRSKGLGKAMSKVEGSKIIVQTAFDAYFTYNKPGRVQTSSNVYNQLVIPLSAEEFSDAIGAKFKGPPVIQPSILSEENRELIFSRFMCELNEGFNILCYGVGSKRRLLNQFATTHCSKHGHVVVANGFQPDFVLKDLLCSIEDVPHVELNGHILVPLQNVASLHCSSRCDAPEPDWPPRGLEELDRDDRPDDEDDETFGSDVVEGTFPVDALLVNHLVGFVRSCAKPSDGDVDLDSPGDDGGWWW